MNARSSLVALAALLVLSACGGISDPVKSNVAANNTQAATPAPPPSLNNAAKAPHTRVDEMDDPIPAESKADPNMVTRSWFAGRWSDTGDCVDAGTFAPNGTYLLADGTRGMWSVQDGRLFVRHANGNGTFRLRKVDERTVEVINQDGSAGRSIRC